MSEFKSLLDKVVTQVEGVKGLCLLGLDGIPIEKISKQEDDTLESIGAELTTFVKTLQTSPSNLNGQKLEELMVLTPNHIIAFTKVTEDYYLLAIASRGTLTGKLRYHLFTISKDLAKVLE